MEKSQTHPLSCPTQHQIFISPVSKPKPLNCWYRHIEKKHWGWTITGGYWNNVPTVREIYKLDDMAYFGKFSKQVSWKKNTLLSLSNSCFSFSIRVFFQGHWQLGQQGKGGDIYLQLCMWDDYHIFLIASLVFTRLLLNEIYHLIELPFWLIDDVALSVCLFMWWFYSSFFVIAI